ncbi:hypothetical protein PA598K_06913 [Paenibacillus sp. 598K]|uniref:hypothetical protein n=1 Tax=Paenibacillus sp. 598K TaxID=1117987 RepID=UPI000FFAE83E|nr:hypothetical protein [Paenibacillus sp. 598K]GBF78289.1 hypothetical protein PA598K_06913 [Paenibacillus sp. 598K]
MASPRVKPRLLARGRRASAPLIKVKPVGAASSGPIFSRFTAVWVQSNGVPFDTSGFFARLFRGNTLVQTASFDRFGVVRFSRVSTLTQVAYTIRVFDSSGVEFRRRNIPAGVETFAIIG